MIKTKCQKKGNVAQRIHVGFKKYGDDFCLNKKAKERDKIYEPGFYKFLSEILKVSQSSISEYNILRKNGSTALLNAVCKGTSINGVCYSLHLASRRLSEEMRRKRNLEGFKNDKTTLLTDTQTSKILRKIFSVAGN